MPIRVLVVDDSRFYRARIEEMLRADPQIEVVGSASNGIEAVELAHRLKPDALTMDYEMPGMDGIEAIKKILSDRPVPILMLSAMSFAGASTTLKALDAGAVDFLPKAAEGQSLAQGPNVLVDKIKGICAGWRQGAFENSRPSRPSPAGSSFSRSAAHQRQGKSVAPGRSVASGVATARDGVAKSSFPKMSVRGEAAGSDALAGAASGGENRRGVTARDKPAAPDAQQPKTLSNTGFRSNTRLNRDLRLIVIGASTGGPVAVQRILDELPADFPVPIVTVLHMPASFTQAFAERLDQRSKLKVRLACQDTELLPGFVYVAPGGMQTIFDRHKGLIKVVAGKPGVTYKPCVDVSFISAAEAFGGGVLGIVLTGMGADGRDGALALRQAGSSVWVQDAQTCVVYGMPQAVMAAKAADAEMAIGQFADRLVEEVRRGRA